MGVAEITDPAALTALEDEARAVRRLDIEIRRFGRLAGDEERLKQAAASVQAQSDLAAMDRARLLEILLGPQPGGLDIAAAGGGTAEKSADQAQAGQARFGLLQF